MRYLILGGGSVTTEYYLPALAMMGRLADATVVDPEAGAIRSTRPDLAGVDFRTLDYAGFLENLPPPEAPRRDSVIVALPNRLHVAAVRLALGGGRDVLCEKPLTLRTQDCVDLQRLASQQQRRLKVAMSRRYLPSLMLARDIVGARECGDIRAVEVVDCQPMLWQPRSFSFFSPEAGGVLADMGVHYLDYLASLVPGMRPLAYADDAKGGSEASCEYRLSAGDVPITLLLSRLYERPSYLRIVCTRGEIRVDKANENEVTVAPCDAASRRVSLDQPFDDPAWPRDFHGSFCQMLSDFEAAVEGRATRIADIGDAERTVALIEWAYRQRRCNAPTAKHRSAAGTDRQRVLVTGGTGFIGGHLVERLCGHPADIRVAARSPHRCANIARFPVEIVATDLLDQSSVRGAVEDAGIVYHLAYGNDGRNPGRVTIEGTKNVVEAAIAAGADCVVVLSTMYVFGFPQAAGPVDETYPYRPYGGEYGRSKAIMERWCLARSRSSLPTRIVVLNPTCVFGPGGGAYTCLPVDLARQGRFCWISDGAGSCNYSYIDNLIDAILAAAQVPEAHGQRFIISDGTVSWRELIEPMIAPLAPAVPSYTPGEFARLPHYGGPFRLRTLIAAALASPEIRQVAKRSPLVRRAFAFASHLGRGAAGGVGGAPSLGRGGLSEPPIPPHWLAALYGPACCEFSAAKAQRVLHWRPKVDLAGGQAATLQWLQETGRLPATASDR